jgi:Protein of unknown function (DUF1553)/Protein of unknown function (DUF1549)
MVGWKATILSLGLAASLARFAYQSAPDLPGPDLPDQAEKADSVHSEGQQQPFWSFRPPLDVPLPTVKHVDWPRSPIDVYILSKLELNGLEPARAADKRSLIRRATFDLIGLPPTADEIHAFLADDSVDAFARVVDRLLASPHYGERWGRHWLDVARYADSNGMDENLAYANAFRYRDYVVAAFNQDKPYSRFVQEQLAGDLIPFSGDSSATLGSRTRAPESLIATGFLTLGPKMLAEDDPVKMEMDIIDEQIDTIGRTFLGLTLGCARCHDHKFDPLRMEDYYALAGIFKSTGTMDNFKVVARWHERALGTDAELEQQEAMQREIATRKSEIARVTTEANETLLRAARRRVADYLIAARDASEYDALQRDLKSFPHLDKLALIPRDLLGRLATFPPRPAEQLAVHRDLNPDIVRQWSRYLQETKGYPSSVFSAWHALTAVSSDAADGPLFAELKGTAIQALAARYQELFDQADEAWEELKSRPDGKDAKELPDTTTEALRKVLYDPKGPFALPAEPERFYSPVAAGELKRLRDELATLEKSFTPLPEAMAVHEGTPQDSQVHLRGSHLTLGDQVPRGFPRVIARDQTPIDEKQSGRLQLADWLTRPDHPLTSRVMVNRIWRWHFGEGLVRSTDNFGKLGDHPSHPELLDWLARRFIESGWSMKSMHRLIMLSATYQMRTAYSEQAAQLDPDNRLLWRMNRRRLEAECIRDAILATSGQLDTTIGGSLLDGANRTYVKGYPNSIYDKYDFNRRSVYLPVLRSMVYDVFQAFDFADPSTPNGERASTTVAPQALFALNSKLMGEQSRWMAMTLLADSGSDRKRIELAYERALGRLPTDTEATRSLDFIDRYEAALRSRSGDSSDTRLLAWQALCRTILASSEFIYVD